MPSRPSIRWRVAASSWSLPFMNFAAKASMFLPSVTSVTLEARAASSFSTAGGRGNGRSLRLGRQCGDERALSRTYQGQCQSFVSSLDSPYCCSLSWSGSRSQAQIHFVERVPGDAQRRHHLAGAPLRPCGDLRLAAVATPSRRPASPPAPGTPPARCHATQQCGVLRSVISRPAPRHDLALEAGGRGPPLQRLLQFLFKFVDVFRFHGCTPSDGLWPWPAAA